MASRFWVGGTGTWDGADTSHWAASSGGASGASVPGSSDDVTFDGASGGGTVTVNTTVTVTTFTMGAFTGTIDFSANNNNVTCSSLFSNSGTGTRTLNMGNGTWTMSGANGFTQSTVTNLTFNANSSTLVFSNSGFVVFNSGGKTFSTVSKTNGGTLYIGQAATIGTFNVTAPATIQNAAGLTITNAPTWTGTSSNMIGFFGVTSAITVTLSSGNAALTYCVLGGITFSGGTNTATNSIALPNVSGITVTAPSFGGTRVYNG